MKKRFELQDEFDKSQDENGYNHFTHYDYLLQVIGNGQMSAFKSHLKEITSEGLLTFLPLAGSDKWVNAVKDEIMGRIK